MKNSKNYVMTSTATLTQSGLLAVLLQRQRRKVIELARRRTRRDQVRAVFGDYWRAFHGATVGRLIPRSFGRTVPRHTWIFHQAMAMAHQVHTYTELRQQIHDDLRIQHPEWVEPNGESPMCDSYEARLMELLLAATPSADFQKRVDDKFRK
jgi:hypothetical protein